jgi:hypothetical protein
LSAGSVGAGITFRARTVDRLATSLTVEAAGSVSVFTAQRSTPQRPRLVSRVASFSYALVEAGDPETIDLFLSEQDAQHALEGCVRDEPEWRELLRVEEIELADAELSPN